MKNILYIALFSLLATTVNAQEYYTEYHENGRIKALYSATDAEIKADFYYDNGKLQEVGFVKKGQRHGNWVQWDKQGNRIAEASYKKGKKTGPWYFYHANGNLKYELHYKNGKRVSAIHWDELGNLVTN